MLYHNYAAAIQYGLNFYLLLYAGIADCGIAFICILISIVGMWVILTFELDKLHNPLYIA